MPVFQDGALPVFEQLSATEGVLTLSANAIRNSNGPIETYAVYIKIAHSSGKKYSIILAHISL